MKKHATRNELAQAFIDIWLTLNFHVCGNDVLRTSPMKVDKRATRAELQRQIIDMKLQVKGLLHKYKKLIDDEVDLNNRRCMKKQRNMC